LSAFIIRFGH